MKAPRPKDSNRIRRGIYLLPSVFTLGNMMLGFYAIVCGLRGDFQTAAILIFVAGLLDAFDGRLARLTNTESDFGREFDSLADALTFGAAPAILSHIWGLRAIDRLGWLIPLFYLVCALARLARFNVQNRAADTRFFVGLPSPVAASTVGAVLFFAPEAGIRSTQLTMMVTLIICGVLMVSTFRYFSFKHFDLRQRWSYRTAVVMAVLALLIAYNPPAVFFITAIAYSAHGPVVWLARRFSARSVGATGRDVEHHH